ncbi:hypothetical protein D3C71_954890 [compost metagenome]
MEVEPAADASAVVAQAQHPPAPHFAHHQRQCDRRAEADEHSAIDALECRTFFCHRPAQGVVADQAAQPLGEDDLRIECLDLRQQMLRQRRAQLGVLDPLHDGANGGAQHLIDRQAPTAEVVVGLAPGVGAQHRQASGDLGEVRPLLELLVEGQEVDVLVIYEATVLRQLSTDQCAPLVLPVRIDAALPLAGWRETDTRQAQDAQPCWRDFRPRFCQGFAGRHCNGANSLPLGGHHQILQASQFRLQAVGTGRGRRERGLSRISQGAAAVAEKTADPLGAALPDLLWIEAVKVTGGAVHHLPTLGRQFRLDQWQPDATGHHGGRQFWRSRYAQCSAPDGCIAEVLRGDHPWAEGTARQFEVIAKKRQQAGVIVMLGLDAARPGNQAWLEPRRSQDRRNPNAEAGEWIFPWDIGR